MEMKNGWMDDGWRMEWVEWVLTGTRYDPARTSWFRDTE